MDWSDYWLSMKQDYRHIEKVLDDIEPLGPVKIVWNNNVELYNDYDADKEELSPYKETVMSRLTLYKPDKVFLVSRYEVYIVQHHHSLIYMYGDEIAEVNYKPDIFDIMK